MPTNYLYFGNMKKLISLGIVIFCVVTVVCSQTIHDSSSKINSNLFQHHFVVQDLPGKAGWGYGCPTLADYDNDGDLDYSFSGSQGLYWFENRGINLWIRHDVGEMPLRALGANSHDVDQDGWEDIIIGGFWFRNTGSPKEDGFERIPYDTSIQTNIHDIVISDIDGDQEQDIVVLGEDEGLFWYSITKNPQNLWEKNTITLEVLESREHIHAGFFPNGVADLDGDQDVDIVLPNQWLENRDQGKSWVSHPLPFGKRGPYGLSSRSWICDLDHDGDMDIVMSDCDQSASRIAWLENDGQSVPSFTARFLPMKAPGIRGSFHSLFVGDLDNDGDDDILTCDQEDDSIPPEGATPRWYVWENTGSKDHPVFEERVILDNRIGGHDALVGDLDNDGDLDVVSKVWNLWPESGNNGVEHGDVIENLLIDQ